MSDADGAPKGPGSFAGDAGLDPHARAADHSLRPDPKGEHDPVRGAGLGPHDRADDFTLRADPAGVHDPLKGADFDPHARAADYSRSTGAGSTAESLRDRAEAATAEARERVAEHADAIQDRIGEAAEDARGRIRSAYGDARSWAEDTRQSGLRRIDDLTDRSREGLDRGRTAVEQFVNENPLLVGVVGVAAGLLLGALLPRTRQEDRNLGPFADEMRDQGLRYAREFTSRGREFVHNALDPENVNAAARRTAGDNDDGRPPSDPVRHTL
ncbi:hypothetical protein [Methylobacterium dankookense]|uniref:DUF883 domain-containing protein n=1 Tax=Methylobacterium dankookense TaxID=560405 RepID=A0A564FYF9_9HYPH|nr:hypothetical protein [Methylobacterium dankookense]GJD54241.1 hypothetical protein IFDJLNFL_0109 [Methylobacterium dankookense]VUF12914.1 hypothetical protein MTDSW087_02609 [Methylobacterium dankookense]